MINIHINIEAATAEEAKRELRKLASFSAESGGNCTNHYTGPQDSDEAETETKADAPEKPSTKKTGKKSSKKTEPVVEDAPAEEETPATEEDAEEAEGEGPGEDASEETEKVEYEDLRAAMAKAKKDAGLDVKATLAKFKADKLSGVAESDYPALLKIAQDALAKKGAA